MTQYLYENLKNILSINMILINLFNILRIYLTLNSRHLAPFQSPHWTHRNLGIWVRRGWLMVMSIIINQHSPNLFLIFLLPLWPSGRPKSGLYVNRKDPMYFIHYPHRTTTFQWKATAGRSVLKLLADDYSSLLVPILCN